MSRRPRSSPLSPTPPLSPPPPPAPPPRRYPGHLPVWAPPHRRPAPLPLTSPNTGATPASSPFAAANGELAGVAPVFGLVSGSGAGLRCGGAQTGRCPGYRRGGGAGGGGGERGGVGERGELRGRRLI